MEEKSTGQRLIILKIYILQRWSLCDIAQEFNTDQSRRLSQRSRHILNATKWYFFLFVSDIVSLVEKLGL